MKGGMRQQERAGEGSKGKIQFWLEMGFSLSWELWSVTQVPHLCAPPSSGSGSPPLCPLSGSVSLAWQGPFSGGGGPGLSSASLSTVELKGSGRDTSLNATGSLSALSCYPLIVDLGLIGSEPHSRLDSLCFLASHHLPPCLSDPK